jgi:zinc transport system ATP-binding protein
MKDGTQLEDGVVLRTRGLALGYGQQQLVRDVDLEICRGDYWFLLGSNGQGKTTFLRTVLGLMPPAAGELWRNPRLASRRQVGFVPQGCQMHSTLPTTIREFVALGLVGIPIGRAERAERMSGALEKVGLHGMDRCDYWSLSGGQRQRALVARALIRHPTLLVLDEPTSGLDPASEDAVMQALTSLHDDGCTLLFVTHDVDVAVRHATHAALFHGGKVIAGSAVEMLSRENLERIYGGGSTSAGNDHLRSLGGHA